MAKFLTVNVIHGEALVQGTVRPVVFDKGDLTIRGLTLPEAMALLGSLAGDALVVANIGGLIPQASAQVAPVPQAPQVAPVPSPRTTAPESVAQVAPPPPAPVAQASFVLAPPVASVAPPEAPVAPTPAPEPAAAPVAPASAPQSPPRAAGPELPPEVLKAQTLRPVLIWLSEQYALRNEVLTLEQALTDLSGLRGRIPTLAKIDDASLRERTERTLTSLKS